MAEINNIVLQFPCPLEKESFDKTRSGYHCNKCSTEVVDFTCKSSDDLQREIRKAQDPVCGIFRKSQLSSQFIKYAATTFVVSSALTLQSFAQEKTKIDSTSKSHENIDAETEPVIFGMIIETQPLPVGGYEKFYSALSKEIKYPKDLKEKGKCFVEFFIDSTGSAHSFKIIKSFNIDADREALGALTRLNYHWSPAKQRGKPIAARFILPIVFDPDKQRK